MTTLDPRFLRALERHLLGCCVMTRGALVSHIDLRSLETEGTQGFSDSELVEFFVEKLVFELAMIFLMIIFCVFFHARLPLATRGTSSTDVLISIDESSLGRGVASSSLLYSTVCADCFLNEKYEKSATFGS